MTPRIHLCALALGLLTFAAGAAGQDAAEPPPEVPVGLSVGVAPFEAVAPPGADVPDVATLLADRLATSGMGPVVGPSQLGAPADAEPGAETVVEWAARAGVAAVVVGRTTRLGSALSISARVRSGESGEVLATYVAEVGAPDRLGGAVETLASRVVEGERARHPAVAAAPAPEELGKADPEPAEGTGDESPFGIVGFDNDKPIAISSDELEALQSGGARRLLFSRNVVVEQDDVRLSSDRLEAYYPPDASQPERLVATGRVRFVRGEREARCDRAVYERTQEMLICRGNAQLREGKDRVDGEIIEFDLARDTVKVKGGAKVIFTPEKQDTAGGRG